MASVDPSVPPPDRSRESPRGPSTATERALAPDLARGFMLLLIAVANTPWYLWGRDYTMSSIHPPDGAWWDQLTQIVIITAVDGRIYPMFAFLFGYGMVQLLLRQEAAGVPERAALALLRRRNLWLLVFGCAHAALLFMGDILGAYGLAGLVLAALFLRRSNRTLLVWSAVLGIVLLLFLAFSLLGAYAAAVLGEPVEQGFTPYKFAESTMAEDSYLHSVVERLLVWPLLVVMQGLLGLAVPIAILLGFWAARHRVLEQPEQNLRLLGWTAFVGIAVGWLGGAPHAVTHTGLVPFPEDAMFVFSTLMLPTGLAGGVGYVALFGLIGYWLRNRPSGPVTTAVSAVGKRSLSCYLAQSVVCAPLLAAWGLGLGAHLHSSSMALFAVAVWLVILLAAWGLERAGRRGPAEVLLRRLTYRTAPDSR
ncbi:DUF418 domain-containing protein [Lipingzhangella rawalii]|nr:DUF418 domain-containing protein [Lipingzhangella rawalii]